MVIIVHDRVIFHIDCNSFFASVMLLYNPHLRDKPVAVGGDPDTRHGIILAKNDIAKKAGVSTTMALWQARQVCRDLIIIPVDYALISRYSKAAKEIYSEYTDLQQSFGSDESWLDVTGSFSIFNKRPDYLANDIRKRIKRELGITVSIGISWNKVFAKLGSDMFKPDAITDLSRCSPDDTDWQDRIYPLPVEDLLYIGPATKRKLHNKGIYTIGELADIDEKFLREWFGKIGTEIHQYATGQEHSLVSHEDDVAMVKSVGNSSVTPKDLTRPAEAKNLIDILSESVGPRMRVAGLMGSTIEMWVCDKNLDYRVRQCKMPTPTNLNTDIAGAAWRLFQKTYRWQEPVRKIGISVSSLEFDSSPYQITFDESAERRERRETLESAIDHLNNRWPHCVTRCSTMVSTDLIDLSRKEHERQFTPISWL